MKKFQYIILGVIVLFCSLLVIEKLRAIDKKRGDRPRKKGPKKWKKKKKKEKLDNKDDYNAKKLLADGTIGEVLLRIHRIPHTFTASKTLPAQRRAHELAKDFLKKHLTALAGSYIAFVNPRKITKDDDIMVAFPKNSDIHPDRLNPDVFYWEHTDGVQNDIMRDSFRENVIVIYGVASQFTGSESPSSRLISIGKAYKSYPEDLTQGPYSQMQFGYNQVELLNAAAHIGFNALIHTLDKQTKSAVLGGYLMPRDHEAKRLAIQLVENGHLIEYPFVGNIPIDHFSREKGKYPVFQMLIAAPALGSDWDENRKGAKKPEKGILNRIEYLCALRAFEAQFKKAIEMAKANPKMHVVAKPVGVGLGVFDNKEINIAKAFYIAAMHFQEDLKRYNVKVLWQIFVNSKGEEDKATKKIARMLNLQEYSQE